MNMQIKHLLSKKSFLCKLEQVAFCISARLVQTAVCNISKHVTYQNFNIFKSTITEAFLQLPCQFFNKL